MTWYKNELPMIVEFIEKSLGIKTKKWYFNGKNDWRKITIWITKGGRIAIRYQHGNGKQVTGCAFPSYWVLNTPRYYKTARGLAVYIKKIILPELADYHIPTS